MRARNIKPAYFTNEALGTLDPVIGLLFIGLWMIADRRGILEDRPARIKAELFPYRENLDVNGYLTVIERCGFVKRYEVDGKRYIKVLNFEKHQSPHHTEKARDFPEPDSSPLDNGYVTVTQPDEHGEVTVTKRSDSLIPDSLIHSSDGSDGYGFKENIKKNKEEEAENVAHVAQAVPENDPVPMPWPDDPEPEPEPETGAGHPAFADPPPEHPYTNLRPPEAQPPPLHSSRLPPRREPDPEVGRGDDFPLKHATGHLGKVLARLEAAKAERDAQRDKREAYRKAQGGGE